MFHTDTHHNHNYNDNQTTASNPATDNASEAPSASTPAPHATAEAPSSTAILAAIADDEQFREDLLEWVRANAN